MQVALVLDRNRKPLMPCHPARVRELLCQGKAAVFRRVPFTIILKDRVGGEIQPVELKLDPGSKTTGVVLVTDRQRGKKAVWAGEVNHRGQAIMDGLLSRRQIRRSRRSRKTRYRAARFNNRTRPQGWLPPSLMSRVGNCMAWAKKLQRLAPISAVAVEIVRFDTQMMLNPEISGVEYQQGELQGYEVREYLLEKFSRQCVYCRGKNIPLQIEHVQAKSRKGSDRVSNLALACPECNTAKGNMDVREFLAKKPEVLRKLLVQLKTPLRDAAAVNATRYTIGAALKTLGLPVSFWSGGRTKFNRSCQGYVKAHWLDAACVGESGAKVHVPASTRPLTITATGRGSRQMCRMDRFGFPRTKAKALKTVQGFKTGDLVKAVVPNGKKAGTHVGRVAVRARGSFNIRTQAGLISDISWKHCRLLHRGDGYNYDLGDGASSTQKNDGRRRDA